MRAETPKPSAVVLRGEACIFEIHRLRPGVLYMAVRGYDKGDLGTRALDEIAAELARFERLEWFMDLRGVLGVTTGVRELWTAWFKAHVASLGRVVALVDSSFMKLTIGVAEVFSGVQPQVHTDEERFLEALRKRVPGLASLPPPPV